MIPATLPRTAIRLFSVLITALFLSACDGRNSFSNYSNYDLSQEYQKCQRGGLSPAGAQRCNNVEAECKRRKEESNYRC